MGGEKKINQYRKAVQVQTSTDGKRELYVDLENSKEIFGYLNKDEKHKKKFSNISQVILQGLRNAELYTKENIDKNCDNVYAMKFFKRGDNDRIYCKEYSSEKKIRIVIMCRLHLKKKSQKNSNREKQIIKSVASYEYNF